MELTKRLETIASYVNKGDRVADIGTDHGYIPIYLIKENIASHVLAMDINKGPLEKAKSNGKAYLTDGKIDYRLSNGLNKLEAGEVDTVIIAGMGGKLVETILETDKDKISSYKRLILSPHRDLESLRSSLTAFGLEIIEEDMVFEEGHYYHILVTEQKTLNQSQKNIEFLQFIKDEENLLKIYNKYGKLLIEAKHPLLIEEVEQEITVNEKLLKNMEAKGLEQRAKEVKFELELGKKVLEWVR